MRSFILFTTAATMVGCYADHTVGTALTERDGLKRSETVVGAGAVTAWLGLSALERKAAVDAINRVAPGAAFPQPLAIAVTENSLPSDAAAIVIRETGLPQARIILFSANALDDEALSLALQALFDDEHQRPVVLRRRVLNVARDGSVSRSASTKVRRVSAVETNFTVGIETLLGAATSSGVIELKDVGRVRLFRFE